MLPRQTIRGYLLALLLACFLFAIHTCVIFETSVLLTTSAPPLMEVASVHLVGPLLILVSFLILFVTHLLEAAAWGFYFWRMGQCPTFTEGIYFSGTSLTALGYGDVVLQKPWRVLGPVMATNGLLMYGCSTAFLFFVIQKVWHFS